MVCIARAELRRVGVSTPILASVQPFSQIQIAYGRSLERFNEMISGPNDQFETTLSRERGFNAPDRFGEGGHYGSGAVTAGLDARLIGPHFLGINRVSAPTPSKAYHVRPGFW